MIYVFTFIGEFGYELLNWQGTLRKWVRENKKEGDEIVVCSRKGLDLMYESADYYLNEVPNNEMINYLSAADLGISLRDFHPMNSIVTSGKIIDYLACGLPVITTNILFLESN